MVPSPEDELFSISTESADDEDLLDLLLEEEGYTVLKAETITPIDKTESLPLSPGQQRLWFLDQLEPNNVAYNIPLALRLQGALDEAALEQALNRLLERHESLRTTFAVERGQPRQVIQPTATLQLDRVDLSHLTPTAQQVEANRLVQAEARRLFYLTAGPLFRALLLDLAEAEHWLLLTMHHIISDGWSMALLTHELTTFYSAETEQMPADLPPLPVQYADFAHWQRQYLQSETLEVQAIYWQQQLAGSPPVLNLPLDHPRPPVQTYNGAKQTVTLPLDLQERLKAVGQQEEATLFMTLLAAFKTLLFRYTQQTDITVGTPAANRNQVEIEHVVGFFVNTLVLRTDLTGSPTFRELLQQVRQTALAAYEHQDVPFERLVEALQPERNLSYSPLFQVMFVLQNVAAPPLSAAGVRFSPIPVDNQTAKVDLTLEATETEAGLLCVWEYNTDLFEAATINRLIRHFETLLRGIIADPDQPITTLPLLTPTEQQRLLTQWNETDVHYPPRRCLHHSFEAQAVKNPDAPALTFEGRSLTYAALNERANQLAHYLRRLGVGPESLVGVYMDRSPELMVAILGVLKAGGAYVPLDPVNPAERLAFIIADAQLSILLTQQHLLETVPAQAEHIICLDQEPAGLAEQPVVNPDSGVQPENLAYVIYTSGSTGQPKGTLITHYNVGRLFEATAAWFRFGRDDVWTLFHSYAFDFSVWEMWGAWLYGGRLVIVPYWQSRSPHDFYQLLRTEGVTVLNQTPSAFQQLMQTEATQGVADDLALRWVIFGGEKLELSSLRLWFERHGDDQPRLVNMYGITETTVHVTYRPLTQADVEAAAGSLIGQPIPDLQLYILDPQQNLSPIGVLGELYVGGAGLARSYLNRPDLTHERFIPNPFWELAGKSPFSLKPNVTRINGNGRSPERRLYKTGDVGRRLANGDIEYLGRIDHQVKIRGFRIELGEIEVVLRQHPTVQSCLMIAQEDSPDHKRLVAYVVASAESNPAQNLAAEWRHFLEAKLPSYMIPALFVRLDAFPLTANGKIDRRALPEPKTVTVTPSTTLVPPRTPLESTLVDIWQRVLGVERVSIHDNFFELGGDSILTLQIIVRAREAGIHLTSKQLFQHQTVATLAEAATTRQVTQTEQGVVTGSLPLTPIQHWFFEQDLPEKHHWNQSLLLTLRQSFDPEILTQAVQALLRHHDALRLRFEPTETGWRQVNAAPDPDNEILPVSQVDLTDLSDDEQWPTLEAIIAEQQASLDLSSGPLLRATQFELGQDRPAYLFIAIHHLAVDGVSWRILLEDLQTAYDQLRRGERVALPPKTTSFKQWAETLGRYAQTEAIRQERDYWLTVVQTKPVALPLDFPADDADNTKASARTVTVSLFPDETQALLSHVPLVYQSRINEVLLTALLQAFAAWTGEPTLLLDLERHGREEIEAGIDLSRTVGWFTSIFPVHLTLTETTDLSAALPSVGTQLRRIPQQGLGYGLLRYLGNDPELIAKLRCQPAIAFNYLGQFDQALVTADYFQPPVRFIGPEYSPLGCRRHQLVINSRISGGQFSADWVYSRNLHRRETIEQLAEAFVAALREVIGRSLADGDSTSSQSLPARGRSEELIPSGRGKGGQVIGPPAILPPPSLPLQGGGVKTSPPVEGIEGGRGPHEPISLPWNRIALPPDLWANLPDGVEDAYPLAGMQAMMLHHHAASPGKGIYHVQQAFHLRDEALSLDVLEMALRLMVKRHPVLRTTFWLDAPGEPLQIVYRDLPFDIERRDLRHLSLDAQNDYLETLMAEDRTIPFTVTAEDDKRRPFFRFWLLHRSAIEVELLMALHHAIIDGWSMGQLLKELLAAYAMLKRRQPVELPTAPPVYKEFVALEKEMMASPEARSFWRDFLVDSPRSSLETDDDSTPSQPPLARGRSETFPPAGGQRGEKSSQINLSAVESRNEGEKREIPPSGGPGGPAPAQTVTVEPDLVARLQTAAQQWQMPLRTLFLSAYLDLIAAQSEADTATVGVVVNGRSEQLSDPLEGVGLFWYVVPFGQAVQPDKAVQTKTVQQALLDLEPYLRYPLGRIEADRQQVNFFWATFNFAHFHNLTEAAPDGIEILGQRTHDRFHWPFNLTVSVDPLDKAVRIRVEYNLHYFMPEQIETLLQRYVTLLKRLTR